MRAGLAGGGARNQDSYQRSFFLYDRGYETEAELDCRRAVRPNLAWWTQVFCRRIQNAFAQCGCMNTRAVVRAPHTYPTAALGLARLCTDDGGAGVRPGLRYCPTRMW